MLSIREISERTGVSIATVSRALDPRYSSKVSAVTRSRILSFCDAHNYRPNVTGRSFVTGKTFKVGVIFGTIIQDLGNPLVGHFMHGICFELQHCGYTPVILHASESKGLDSSVSNFLRSSVADAYIIGSSMLSEKICNAISHCKRPIIATDKIHFDSPQVSIIRRDSVPAYRQAWQYLPEAWRNSTAFVAHLASSSSKLKLEAISEAAPNKETPTSIPLTFPFADFCFDRHSARREAEKIIDQLASYRLLWCASDLTALGIADALEAKGIIPGKDIFLVGHDNIENIPAFRGEAFLSTIDVQWEEWGRLAAKTALAQIDEPNPVRIALSSAFVSRKSFPKQT